MRIKDLQLRNYRNYEYADLKLHAGINVFYGLNAQGKTNLLESLIFLSLSHSHRTNEDTALIRKGEQYARLHCIVDDFSLTAIIHEKGHTLFKNRELMKKSSDFIGLLNVILFSPDDLWIFQSAPKMRRRMIDLEIGKMDRSYVSILNQFRLLLKERNAFLKKNKTDTIYLDILNQRLVNLEIQIIEQRSAFIDAINQYIGMYYEKLSHTSIPVSMVYKCCIDQPYTEEKLVSLHASSEVRDQMMQSTTCGIHHEDIQFQFDEQDINVMASQGQKRMVMLALKMSMLQIIEDRTKQQAILLLDDVLSELDEKRQECLLQMRTHSQMILTTAIVPPILRTNADRLFRIEHGNIFAG